MNIELHSATLVSGVIGFFSLFWSHCGICEDLAKPKHPFLSSPPSQFACSYPTAKCMEELWTEFQSNQFEAKRVMRGARNRTLIHDLADGKYDAIVHSSSLNKHESSKLISAFGSKTSIKTVTIGSYTVGVVANNKIGVRSLTTAQLGDIMRGRIVNWGELGYSRRPIIVFGQNMNSNSTFILRKNCFPGKWLRGDVVQLNSQEAIIAAVQKKPGAIGYFLYNWNDINGVTLIKVGSSKTAGNQTEKTFSPSIRSVSNGNYPLSDSVVCVIHPSAPPITFEFLRFIQSEKSAM